MLPPNVSKVGKSKTQRRKTSLPKTKEIIKGSRLFMRHGVRYLIAAFILQ